MDEYHWCYIFLNTTLHENMVLGEKVFFEQDWNFYLVPKKKDGQFFRPSVLSLKSDPRIKEHKIRY